MDEEVVIVGGILREVCSAPDHQQGRIQQHILRQEARRRRPPTCCFVACARLCAVARKDGVVLMECRIILL